MARVASKSNHDSYTAKDIADFMKKSKKTGNPFVFFTGAGCSHAADIPLAGGIIKDIQRKYKTQLKGLDETQKNDYGYCMSVLSKSERRVLIQGYIKKSKVNWAHIALACMMRDGYISRVLTFNFDNLLARASSLIGLYPATYDFTSANPELHHLIVDPAIVHLHGQGDGFVQLNTDEETKQQAENRLSEFVANTLNSSPSLFIGYSGGADAFFPLLQDKFQGQHRLIWTAHGQQPSEQVGSFLKKNSNLTHFIGEQDADLFLIDLANELGCFPPKLFENPYQHVLDILSSVKDFPTRLEDSVFNLLEQVKQHLAESSKNAGEIKTLKYEKLLMSGKYQQLTNIYTQLKELVINHNDKKIFAWAYTMQGNLFAQSNNNQFSVAYEKAIEIDPKFYNALNNHGAILSRLARLKQNEVLFQQSFEMYEKGLSIKPDYQVALTNYGIALSDLAVLKEDEGFFIKSFEKFESVLKIDPESRENLNGFGIALARFARLKQDETVFIKSFELYEKALKINPSDTDVLNNYGIALYGLAKLKQDEGLFKRSIVCYEKSLNIYPDHVTTLSSYAIVLCAYAKLKQDEDLFKLAHEFFTKVEQFEPDNLYNFACYYSLTNQPDLCKEKLLRCEQADTLPKLHTKKHLMTDNDLDNVRHLDWFQELLARLPD